MNIQLQKKEVGVSRHLPFAYLDEKDIVRTKNGDYMVALKVEGISWDNLEDEELNFEQTLRAQLFGSLADDKFAIYHTIIRSRAETSLFGYYDISTAGQIHDAYQKRLNTQPLFVNDLYLVILLKGSGSKGNRVTSRIKRWFSQVSHYLSQKQAELRHDEAIKSLDEVALRFASALDKYKVRRLKTIKTEQGIYSEQLQFFSRILNGDDHPVLAVHDEISTYLPKRRLFFGAKAIESQGNVSEDTRFSTMLSLKEYPNSTYPGMLDELLQLPVEIVITQSFAFEHRQQTREALELQLRRLKQSHDPDMKGIAQLQEALGSVVSGEFGFGYHHLTAMVSADTLDELEDHVASVTKHLSRCGIVAVRERLNLEASYWAQFPGNFHYIVRKIPVTSANFASMCSLNNDPVGRRLDNHWGNAVTVLKTPANLPYYFNFHQPGSDVGHSLILGMTGSGKTLLTCFLISEAMKYQTRVFYFDKDHGAEAFMRSMGADYSTLGAGVTSGLNPLQLPDTHGNRQFLSTWLKSLLTAFCEELTSDDLSLIDQAVRLNYEKLSPEQRTLSNLSEAFGRSGPGTLRSRIDQWHNNPQLSQFFGATQDNLTLDGRSYCFEMGELLKRANKQVLPSVLLYLFHRIELALDANSQHHPTIICLDEAWALLDNPIFAEGIKNWLKTFRKRNAIVLLLSQELTDITQSSVSATLNSETVTKIFFPNPSPNKELYKNIFQLTDREIALLKEYSADKRYFLIKQPHESVFASLDLYGMTQWIPLLSGNSATKGLLQKLVKEQGSTPEKWLAKYIEGAAHAE